MLVGETLFISKLLLDERLVAETGRVTLLSGEFIEPAAAVTVMSFSFRSPSTVRLPDTVTEAFASPDGKT